MQQMMEGTSGSSAPAWWSLSASMALPQPSNSEIWQQDHHHDGQDLPESWCHLLLGGFIGEEDQKHGLIKRTESDNFGVEPLLHEQVVSSATHTAATGFHDQHHQVQSHGSSSWTQNSTVLQASSPRSCITTSLSTHSMLDFSAKPKHKLPAEHNNSSEGNSTVTAPILKKARVQGSSSPQSILKVRKEKLGDRITALHQLVSPFGKTDTASVLQEAIGYIRFLQSQIEALSSPYLQQQQKQRQAVRQQQYHHQQQRQRQRQRPKHASRGRAAMAAPEWSETAMLVIDMQKDFILAERGSPMLVAGGQAIVPTVIQAVSAARERGILVIWVVREHDRFGRDVEHFRRHFYSDGEGPIVKGCVGAELADGLVIADGDYKLVKTRFSAFFATNLHNLLQGCGIKNLVIVGVQTPNCIRQTVFDAVALDYHSVTLISDATAAAAPQIHSENIRDMKNIGVAAPTLQEWMQL